MDLSSPKLKKILIFAAIFTVIVFIFVKIWRRSYYSYPNESEDAQVPITNMVNGTPAGSVTVTATGHKFKVGDIVLLKNMGTTAITATTGVMPTVTGTTGTPVIVATVTALTSFTFLGSFTGTFAAGGTAESIGYGVMTTLKTALVTCQDTYATSIINAAGVAAAITAAGEERKNCIARAVAPYTRNHCQWLPPAPTTATPNPTLPIPPSGDAKTAYDAYQTDIKTIQLAYVSTANRAAAGTFQGIGADTAKANMIVSAARAADISGATQKYLATVCPGFYQPGDPNIPDPSTRYKSWTAVMGTAGTTDPLAQATQTHFWAPSTGITDAAILTWAQYARTVTFVENTGLTATIGYLSASIMVGGTTYSDKSGFLRTPGLVGTENWRNAYTSGPGTFPVTVWATA